MKDKFGEYYQNKDVVKGYDTQRAAEYREKEKREMLWLLDKQKKDKVVEIGCGTGFLTQFLGKVVAVDYSDEMIKKAKERAPLATYKQASLFNLRCFESNYFNKAISLRVFDHLNKQEVLDGLIQINRILKPNGIFVFDLEEKSWLRRIAKFFYVLLKGKQGAKIYQYSVKDIQQFSDITGFVITEISKVKHKVGSQLFIRLQKKHDN